MADAASYAHAEQDMAHSHSHAEQGSVPSRNMTDTGSYASDREKGGVVDQLEHAAGGYDKDRPSAQKGEYNEDDNPYIHHHMSWSLFGSLVAMSFLWVGSQIPLYLLGGVIPLIYNDIGGYDIYLWLVLGYLIPNAALCPFVGALSDLIGRKPVAAIGQICLIIGPIVVVTAHEMRTAVGGMVIAGLGAGLNELIALAGTAELVPIKKRGTYVGLVVFTILPFCPSVLWAQLIAKSANWRYVGIPICVWNFLGLIFVAFVYKDPSRHRVIDKKKVIKELDVVGGLLSTIGVVLFMMGLQWGALQYTWGSVHVLVPFILGILFIIAFFVWEAKFAKHPMVPKALFSKDKRTMICVLLITFFSGGNFFALLLFWPTQIYNQYGDDPLKVGIRALPIGFGIIGGAAIALISIPILKGRTTPLIIVATIIMTAGTGLMSLARTDNLGAVYAIVTIASLGTGAVIIPCSIIAQVVCPPELIGTITAISLAIRYIGGAIAFTAYYNIFYPKLLEYVQTIGVHAIFINYISGDVQTITDLLTYAAQAMYGKLADLIATSPNVNYRPIAYDVIIEAVQEAFALAYRWPYWMSIAFGGVCIVCACGLRDIKKYL